MNHTARARGILKRVLAPHLHKSDLFELLELEVTRGLRRAEQDGYRVGVGRAANRVGDYFDRRPGPVGDKHGLIAELVEVLAQKP